MAAALKTVALKTVAPGTGRVIGMAIGLAIVAGLVLASGPAQADRKAPRADGPETGVSEDAPEARGDARVFGFWEPPDMDAVIAIMRCGEGLCAKLVRHRYEAFAQTDVNNPDPALRARALNGLAIIEGLRAVGRGAWRGGAFYDPRTGRTYSPRLKLLDDNRLKISGCIAPRLCKGYVWTRVAPSRSVISAPRAPG